MRVQDIMNRKVVTELPSTTVRDAIGIMTKKAIGSIIIAKGNSIYGIVTEHDIINALAEYDEAEINEMAVSEIMTSGVITIPPDETIDRAADMMKKRKIKKLLVVRGPSEIVGIITSSDIAAAKPELVRDLSKTIAKERQSK